MTITKENTKVATLIPNLSIIKPPKKGKTQLGKEARDVSKFTSKMSILRKS